MAAQASSSVGVSKNKFSGISTPDWRQNRQLGERHLVARRERSIASAATRLRPNGGNLPWGYYLGSANVWGMHLRIRLAGAFATALLGWLGAQRPWQQANNR